MELGRTQKLEIVRMVDFGAYLGTDDAGGSAMCKGQLHRTPESGQL